MASRFCSHFREERGRLFNHLAGTVFSGFYSEAPEPVISDEGSDGNGPAAEATCGHRQLFEIARHLQLSPANPAYSRLAAVIAI